MKKRVLGFIFLGCLFFAGNAMAAQLVFKDTAVEQEGDWTTSTLIYYDAPCTNEDNCNMYINYSLPWNNIDGVKVTLQIEREHPLYSFYMRYNNYAGGGGTWHVPEHTYNGPAGSVWGYTLHDQSHYNNDFTCATHVSGAYAKIVYRYYDGGTQYTKRLYRVSCV